MSDRKAAILIMAVPLALVFIMVILLLLGK